MAGALIGALRVSLSAETSAFEAGMKRSQRTAQKTATGIEGAFKGVGSALKAGIAGFVSAISVGAIIAAGKAALDYAGSLGEVAQQLGVTTRDLQNFRAAAGQNGISTEELDGALGKLTVTLGKVAAGAAAPTKALAAIGITADELKGKDTGEAFRMIADGLAKVQDRSQRAAVEFAIFGRTGAKLDTLLAGGSAAINNLADANERLGGVLSDEQIQRADVTADKLEALQTVLKAQIAGVVADNSDAIIGLANSLVFLVNKIGTAIRAYQAFVATMEIAGGKLQALDPTNSSAGRSQGRLRVVAGQIALRDLQRQQAGGSSAADRAARLRRGLGMNAPAPRPTGGGIPQFLAGGGGGGGRKRSGGRDRSAEEAQRKLLDNLRDQQQFDQDILRSKHEILQSQRALATNADNRANIDLELLASERRQFESQMAYERQVYDITKGAEGISEAQAEQKRQLYDINEGLQRQAIEEDQQRELQREVARLKDVDFDLQREKLDLEAGLAETASEQRDVQLRLLDLWYRQERAKLDAIMAEEAIGSAAWEEARQRKAALDANQQARRDNVNAGTRGPMEEYLNSLPGTTEKWNEALEEVQVRGLQSLEDGLMSIIDGTKSVGEAFRDMANQIIQDLIRIAIQKAIVAAIGGGFSGGGEVGAIGMATGGFVSGPGGPREDRVPAMLSAGEYVVNAKSTQKFLPLLKGINEGKFAHLATGGLAIPRASMGERVKMANDNSSLADRNRPYFDLRGAVMTKDLLDQMNAIGAQAADTGGNLGVQRMRDLNQRTFGKAAR